jgi:hypothetical protein
VLKYTLRGTVAGCELMQLASFSHRGKEEFQTNNKSVVRALAINDLCRAMEAGLGKAQEHPVPRAPFVFRRYADAARAYVLGNSCRFRRRGPWAGKLYHHFFRDPFMGSPTRHSHMIATAPLSRRGVMGRGIYPAEGY